MEPLLATLWIYQRCATRSVALLRQNWLVALSLPAYAVLLAVARVIAQPLGIVGGVLVALASSACTSSFLYLIEQILRSGRADLGDFQRGFGVYLWEVVRISFLFWIAATVLRLMLTGQPNAGLIMLCATVAVYILFNVVPELIYQSHESGIGLVAASYRFIAANWIEWFPPNVLAAVVTVWTVRAAGGLHLALPLAMVVEGVVTGLLLVFLMTFRGLLFSELNSSTGRGRTFRYRARR
ncbi:MAG: hypothetical protein PVF51_08065 [Nitrospirota bacterium]|jgi:hypothetical protein